MSATPPSLHESLIPVLRYRDVAAAAAWLCTAFGFQQKSLVATEDGTAIYAELSHGRGTLMLVPVGQSDLDAHMRQPDELDGVETQTCYVTVSDADIHYHRSVDQGADVILPLSSDNSGQRGYTCRDLEGHIWSFGTYAPAHHRDIDLYRPVDPEFAGGKSPAFHRGKRAAAIILPLSLVAVAGAAWLMPENPLAGKGEELWTRVTSSSSQCEAGAAANPTANSGLRSVSLRQSEDTILKLRQEISDTKALLAKTRDSATNFSRDLSAEYARRTAAEKLAEDNRLAMQQAEAAQAAASQSLARLETELHKERSARGAAVQSTEHVKGQLENEIAKREKLEQVIRADGKTIPPPVDGQQSAKSPLSAIPNETGSVGQSGTPSTQATPDAPAAVDITPASAIPPVSATALPKKPKPVKSVKRSAPPKTAAAKPAKTKNNNQWPYSEW